MSDDQIKILGIKISSLNLDEVLEEVEKSLKCNKATRQQGNKADEKTLVIFTPNPEIIVYSQKDQEFKKIVNTAQINIPDGLGLILAAKILGQPLKERISGVDLMEKLVKLAAIKSLTVGLIGGSRGVAVRALECLRQKYPGLLGWAEEGPVVPKATSLPLSPDASGRKVSARGGLMKLINYGSYNFYNLYQKIQQTKTSFLFVGLGCPKQEYFINELASVMLNSVQHPFRHSGEPRRRRDKLRDSRIGSSSSEDGVWTHSASSVQASQNDNGELVLMAVGGSFDYLSGKIKRAPLFIRSIGFEWVWRLLRQPWRWKRQFSLIKFIWLVLKQKLASQGVTLRS